ncbi:hypothetical protein [Clavibacter michiganensis]|nr:hypothetical protein [Clavibacter michiganensis]
MTILVQAAEVAVDQYGGSMRIPCTTLSILSIATVALCASAAPASADPPGHPDSASVGRSAIDHARIARRLADFDVPEALRPGLLHALESGRIVDAATGVAPSSIDTIRRDGLVHHVSRFADGSFIATAVETPGAAAVHPDDVQACSRYTGAGVTAYSHCLVISDTPTLTLQFRASYHRSAGASGIDEIADWDIQAYGGSCALQEFDIVKARYGAATGPAKARLRCFANAVSGIASSHPHLDLVVDGAGGHSESNS